MQKLFIILTVTKYGLLYQTGVGGTTAGMQANMFLLVPENVPSPPGAVDRSIMMCDSTLMIISAEDILIRLMTRELYHLEQNETERTKRKKKKINGTVPVCKSLKSLKTLEAPADFNSE